MPHAVVLQTYSKANTTGGTFADTLSAAAAPDSLTVPFFNANARILKMWGIDSDSIAELAMTDGRVDSIHDPTFGVRFNIPSLVPGGAGLVGAQNLLVPPATIPIYSGDTLQFSVTTTAADDVVVSTLTEYDDLPGTQGNFASWDVVRNMVYTRIGVRCAPVASGTPGLYGTARAINADDARWTGGKYYAILGWTTQTMVTTISLTGAAWGNNRIGLPNGVLDLRSDNGFVELSQALNKPLIPVFNGYDAGNVFLSVNDAEASTTPKVDILAYELTGNPLLV